MYKNFNAPSTESLDFIFNMLQKIVSQLAILGENISQEDLNLKFLRILSFEWNTHVVVWRNKPDLDSMSFDDLYNKFKIGKQEVKRTVTSCSNSGSQNVAFVSTPSSTNEVNTANVQVSTANSKVSTDSTHDNTANLSDATVYDFLSNQRNGSQLVHKDLEQIHEDDLEEMDLKWQLALLSMRARKYYQRTRKKITINGSDTAGYDKSKGECFNCHKMGHFARECRGPRNQESRARNQDTSRRTVNVEDISSKAMVADRADFDWSYMADEEVPTNLALMAFSDSEKRCGYNAVPPPPTGLFAPPSIDLSNSGLKKFRQPEFKGYGLKENKVSDCDEDEPEVRILKSDNVQQKPKQANQPRKVSENPRTNFVPTALLTKSGIVSVSVGRPINTSAPKTFINSVITAKGNRVTSAVGEQGINDVKSLACWVWRPKINVLDHVSKNSGSYISKQLDYVDPISRHKYNSFIYLLSKPYTLSVKSQLLLPTTNSFYIDLNRALTSVLCSYLLYMANMDFCDKHNMVAFLQKPTGSEEFHQIVDFLAGSHIRYALTANPTIYVSLIEHFWQTTIVETVNDGEQQITVTVDRQTIAITKASVRRHLQLADAYGISSLPNTEILEQLTLMGYVSNDDKLTFQKREHIPLFDSIRIHDQPGQGEGPTLTVESQYTPISSPTTSQPTTSQPMSSQEQPSQVPTTESIITTLSPPLYETKIPHTTSSMPHDSPLSGGDTPGSDEGSKKLNELTELCTKLFDKVTSLEDDLKQTKKVYGKAFTKLVKRVKHLETKLKSTSVRRKAGMVILDDEEDLILEDPSKQGRMTETEYEDITPIKVSQDASRERVKTYKSYTRKRRSTVSSRDSTAGGLFSTAEEILSTDERIAQKLNKEEMAKAIARKEHERIDFEKALELQKYEVEKTKTKRVVEKTLLQESFKKLRTAEASRIKKILEDYQVKERFRSAEPTEDMERALWVKLKRLFELDKDDVLWKLQKYMHDPLTWRLYDTCGVHHVSSTRAHDIYMLTEKDYPLSTTVMGLMLSRRLQVEEDSEMARHLSVEIDRLKQTLSEHLKEKESLIQTVTLLKNDFKKEESRNIDREIALEKKIKQLDNIVFKRDQSAQIVHMLMKPQFFYDHTTKQALGFQNPFYLKKAQELKPKLYDGNVIKNTSAIVIPDSEETLMLAEESRSKMLLKQQDPMMLEKKNSVNSPEPTLSSRPTKFEVPKELPKVSMVNMSLKKLKYHLAGFDVVVKERTTPTAITEGSWGFEHTKACFRVEIISFVKALKDLFNTFNQYLIDELSEVQNVFHQMEQAIEQHRVESKTFKCLKIETELLHKKDFVEKEIYDKLFKSFTTLEKHCISLEVDTQLNQEIFQRDNSVSNQSAPSFDQLFELNELKAQSQEKDTVIKKLKERIKSLSGKMNEDKIKKDLEEIETINIELDHRVSKLIAENEHLKQTYKQLYDSIKPARIRSKEQCDDLINQVNLKSVEISDLNASLQEKVLEITALKDDLRKLKGKL
ncbi:retrovirus-related pol polyprotein from transposon TNT 1-94 [Tanacetum coccineum]